MKVFALLCGLALAGALLWNSPARCQISACPAIQCIRSHQCAGNCVCAKGPKDAFGYCTGMVRNQP